VSDALARSENFPPFVKGDQGGFSVNVVKVSAANRSIPLEKEGSDQLKSSTVSLAQNPSTLK
jgi:D-alanine-D-alanine ligase-like ATP-grasp enzyme